jgi:CHAD domain-containing protein
VIRSRWPDELGMTSPKPSPNPSVTNLLRLRVRTLFEQLPRAVAGDAEAVHELRIAARRLRVALPVLAARSAGKRQLRCRAALRVLTRVSGATRDLDVVSALLESELADSTAPQVAQTLLRRHMRAARRRSGTRLAQMLLDADIARLRSDLGVLLARGGADLATALGRCTYHMRSQRAELAMGLTALGAKLDVDALHAIRRGVRRLRYLMELHSELDGHTSEAPRLLKGLSDVLGVIHDQHVLATWLFDHSRRARARGAAEQARVSLRLRTRVGQTLRQYHGRFCNRRPLAIVSRAMRLSGVSISAASERGGGV